VWRMTAFVTVTNEKRHDGVTTQHVLNEQLKHWADRSADAATQQEIAQRLAAAAAAAATAATTTTTAATTTTTTTTTTATTTATATATTTTTTTTTAAAAAAAATAAATATATAASTTTTTTAAPQPVGVAEAVAPTAPSPQPVPSPAVRSRRFEQWLLEFDENRFWAWLGHSDNATHFKSSGMFYYWSNVTTKHEFLKHLWISFGCPGHGKGPWDGYGAVIKSYVRNNNTKGTIRITTPRAAAAAIERHFCSPEYEAKHANAKIQKVVVTFIEASDIPRDVRAPSYSRLVGQKSEFACAALPSPFAAPRLLIQSAFQLFHPPTCLPVTGTCQCGLASCSPARRATGAMAASVGGHLAMA
jgi:hypothetical protein